ncbi:MAG: hypothetical protein KIH08_13750 [Candidatus Freyarchaeota archaeon]|nr:hypothetical protein [Candidatus Jordarchaeia archaeon]
MFLRILKSPKVIQNPKIARDIFIEHLEYVKKRINNKEKIDNIINKYSKDNFTITDALSMVGDILGLSRESITDKSLRIDGHELIPLDPIDENIVKKAKEILS